MGPGLPCYPPNPYPPSYPQRVTGMGQTGSLLGAAQCGWPLAAFTPAACACTRGPVHSPPCWAHLHPDPSPQSGNPRPLPSFNPSPKPQSLLSKSPPPQHPPLPTVTHTCTTHAHTHPHTHPPCSHAGGVLLPQHLCGRCAPGARTCMHACVPCGVVTPRALLDGGGLQNGPWKKPCFR